MSPPPSGLRGCHPLIYLPAPPAKKDSAAHTRRDALQRPPRACLAASPHPERRARYPGSSPPPLTSPGHPLPARLSTPGPGPNNARWTAKVGPNREQSQHRPREPPLLGIPSLVGRWARLGGRQHSRCLLTCIRPLLGVFFSTGLLFPRRACLRRRLNWLLVVAAGGGLLFLSPGRLQRQRTDSS